jgi:PTH1 family peptidyl-tRNA hydrolase
MSSAVRLIVGLGNPGAKYERTRHNIGFDALDAIAQRWFATWQEHKRFKGYFAEARAPGGHKLLLLKPLTYMNKSGEAMRAVLDWYKLAPENVLVVYDDMDLPVGRLRLRLAGSAGGHNGIKSAIAHLGSQNFPRLRLGIGQSGPQRETVAHVLGKFAPNEQSAIAQVLVLASEAIEMALQEGIEKAMSLYNAKVAEAAQNSTSAE